MKCLVGFVCFFCGRGVYWVMNVSVLVLVAPDMALK